MHNIQYTGVVLAVARLRPGSVPASSAQWPGVVLAASRHRLRSGPAPVPTRIRPVLSIWNEMGSRPEFPVLLPKRCSDTGYTYIVSLFL